MRLRFNDARRVIYVRLKRIICNPLHTPLHPLTVYRLMPVYRYLVRSGVICASVLLLLLSLLVVVGRRFVLFTIL